MEQANPRARLPWLAPRLLGWGLDREIGMLPGRVARAFLISRCHSLCPEYQPRRQHYQEHRRSLPPQTRLIRYVADSSFTYL